MLIFDNKHYTHSKVNINDNKHYTHSNVNIR